MDLKFESELKRKIRNEGLKGCFEAGIKSCCLVFQADKRNKTPTQNKQNPFDNAEEQLFFLEHKNPEKKTTRKKRKKGRVR